MLHWQTAAYYQAGYKREYPYGYDYPGRSSQPPFFASPVARFGQNCQVGEPRVLILKFADSKGVIGYPYGCDFLGRSSQSSFNGPPVALTG